MRWEDRRPGQKCAVSQRGCKLPEAPTVPPILTPRSQHENPSAQKKAEIEWGWWEKLTFWEDKSEKSGWHVRIGAVKDLAGRGHLCFPDRLSLRTRPRLDLPRTDSR